MGSAGVRWGHRDRPRPSRPFPHCRLTFQATVSTRTWVPGQPRGPAVASNRKQPRARTFRGFPSGPLSPGQRGHTPTAVRPPVCRTRQSLRSWARPCGGQKALCLRVRSEGAAPGRTPVLGDPPSRVTRGAQRPGRPPGNVSRARPPQTRNRRACLGFEFVPVLCLSAARRRASATRHGHRPPGSARRPLLELVLSRVSWRQKPCGSASSGAAHRGRGLRGASPLPRLLCCSQ